RRQEKRVAGKEDRLAAMNERGRICAARRGSSLVDIELWMTSRRSSCLLVVHPKPVADVVRARALIHDRTSIELVVLEFCAAESGLASPGGARTKRVIVFLRRRASTRIQSTSSSIACRSVQIRSTSCFIASRVSFVARLTGT